MTWTQLGLSKNTKTTPRIRERDDGRASYYPELANSFGIPAGVSCPGATEAFCRQHCYAFDTEGRTNVFNNVAANFNALVGATEDEMFHMLDYMIGRYLQDFDKSAIDQKHNNFRIHWDGDFFSVEYARAWARVVTEYPEIMFWVYTRSFREPVNVVPELLGIDNLSLYLSVDRGNIDDARIMAAEYPTVMMAYCGSTYADALALSEAMQRPHKTLACPENLGRLALAHNGMGACQSCRWCLRGPTAPRRYDIMFFDNPSLQSQLPVSVPVKLSRRDRSAAYDPGAVRLALRPRGAANAFIIDDVEVLDEEPHPMLF
jgi:hypothetical protein